MDHGTAVVRLIHRAGEPIARCGCQIASPSRKGVPSGLALDRESGEGGPVGQIYERAKRASRARAWPEGHGYFPKGKSKETRLLSSVAPRSGPSGAVTSEPTWKAMARKKNRRPLRVLPFSVSAAAGALANGDVVSTAISDTVDEKMWLASMDAIHAARDFTAGEGPIVVGVAHSDYSAAEIEECLEAQASWDASDLVAREQARRKVRTIGTFPNVASGEVLNDGKEIRTKLGWIAEAGMTLQFWTWNKSGAALTTGGIAEHDGRVYASPR